MSSLSHDNELINTSDHDFTVLNIHGVVTSDTMINFGALSVAILSVIFAVPVTNAQDDGRDIFSDKFCKGSLLGYEEEYDRLIPPPGSEKVLGNFNVESRYKRCYPQSGKCEDWQIGQPEEFKIFAGPGFNYQRTGLIKARFQQDRKSIVVEASDHSISTDWRGRLLPYTMNGMKWKFEFVPFRQPLMHETRGPVVTWEDGKLDSDCLHFKAAHTDVLKDSGGNTYRMDTEVVGYGRF